MTQTSSCTQTRVLVVEDNVITSQEIGRQLSNLGYIFIENAYSGQEAIDLANQNHPDLILMDIHLGQGIDGTEAAERIWKSLKIPVVYLTAYTDSETLRKAKLSEPFGYVMKPFDERTLYVAIETALCKHQAEALLTYQKNLLAEVFENVQEGLALVDEYGMIAFCNPAYATLLGEPFPENLIGENVFRFFDHETHAMLVEEMKRRKRGRTSTYELPLITLRGNRRWVRLSVAPRFNQEQEWIGEFVTMFDITDRKGMEQDLQRARDSAEQARRHAEAAQHLAESASEAKGQFLAHLSHEFRTPLNAILGYAQLMLRHNSLSSQSYAAVETILHSGEHLLTMINAVLDFSKIEAGKITLDHAPFDLLHCLRNITEIVQVQTHGKDVRLVCQIAPDLPPRIVGDETRLRQVLLNLLNNALKFTEHGEVIFKVSTLESCPPEVLAVENPRMQNTKIRFEVQDTGIGIAPEYLDQIFLPFSQVNPSYSHTKGTGLGLAICRNLLHLMGSELSVASTPGTGSQFWFELDSVVAQDHGQSFSETGEVPEHVSLQAQGSGFAIAGFQGPPVTILIVDDHDMSRAVLRDTLRNVGFTILEAGNGFDGLEKARIFCPDVVLMDMMMPTLDGFETVRRLRQQPECQNMLIVAISASTTDETQSRSLKAGCDAFLPKPIELEPLLQHIGAHLALEWIAPETPSLPKHTTSENAFFQGMELMPLPADQLSLLYELVRSGDIAGIRAVLPELAAHNPHCIAFLDHLHNLVKGFRMNDIKAFLERYLEVAKKQQDNSL